MDLPEQLQRDRRGYLVSAADWSPEIALELAREEDILLNKAHWEVISVLREFYRQHQLTPNSRVLVKLVRDRMGPACGNSAWLMGLFPGGALKQSTKIAGLPCPEQCF